METLYTHDELVHNFKAAEEILPFIIEQFNPNSMIDVGCGIGTWLKVAKDLGVKEILGVDGSYVDLKLLKIQSEEFLAKDLRNPFDLNKKFDIGLCLEVAEHLPASSAEIFISTLCKHTDIVVFSAAIPSQGGQNHINEQWPNYWANLFLLNGFRFFDILRPVFWNNKNVEFWYKQNMFVFTNRDIIIDNKENKNLLLNQVHPLLFESKVAEINSLNREIESLKRNPGFIKSLKLVFFSIAEKFIKTVSKKTTLI